MNKYLKEFFHRGLMFSGFGPLIAGIIYLIISSNKILDLTGLQIFLAIITTYFIAFIHAGISVITTYDKLNTLQQSSIQGIVLFTIYLTGYLINSWLPLKIIPLLVFSISFILGFIIIWLVVYFTTKKSINKLNEKLNDIISE